MCQYVCALTLSTPRQTDRIALRHGHHGSPHTLQQCEEIYSQKVEASSAITKAITKR